MDDVLPQLQIRRATEADAAALALVGAATFLETYCELIKGSDLIAHVTRSHAESIYAAWAMDPAVVVWIAHTPTGAPAGYAVLAPACLPVEQPRSEDREIVRLYVLTRYQKTGLGHRLMQSAVTEARQGGARRLVLGVYHGNAKALAFYARQGFEIIGRRNFVVGEAVFDDLVLGKTVLDGK
jgi:ribosomal protein S18 acetylase RimI-like enzyme